MRLHSPLREILGSRSRVAVLRTVVLYPRKEFTGRELARLSDTSVAQAQQALSQLRDAGLVERRSAGRTHQWRGVERHILWKSLARLFRTETALLPGLQRDLHRILQRGPKKLGLDLRIRRARSRAIDERR